MKEIDLPKRAEGVEIGRIKPAKTGEALTQCW